MSAFPDFARAHGLIGPFEDDGRIHRCRTEGKQRQKNGAYKWLGSWGWVQDWGAHEKPVLWRAEGQESMPIPREVSRDMDRQRIRYDESAELAARIVQHCSTGSHDYLVRKGFRAMAGLIDAEGKHVPKTKPSRGPYLVIPMRSHRNQGFIQSLQWIDMDGTKLFLAGGQAGGGVHVLGRGPETWYCEGAATGWSLLAGLKALYRQGQVVVCFSASNLKSVAMAGSGARFIMADNDAEQKNGRPGAGQTAAIETGLPWVMPDEVGADANDVHQRDGVRALTDLMRRAYA